jgi:hypothetical protein
MKKLLTSTVLAAALAVAGSAALAQEMIVTVNKTAPIRILLNTDGEGYPLMDFVKFIEINPSYNGATLDTEIPAGTKIKLEM